VTSARRSGVDVRLLVVVGIAIALALAGAGTWALTTNDELQSTRATLATTSGDLAAAQSSLTETTADLDAAKADLATAGEAAKDGEARIGALQFQIERKAACIEAQSANLAEIRRILALERANFAKTTSGSAWAKAHGAAQTAINVAIEDLRKAYESAAAGAYGAANTWIDRSNAQIRKSNAQLKLEDAQIAAINKATDETNAANDAFRATLDDTASTCGE
jgi:chromosome segregation ATPase